LLAGCGFASCGNDASKEPPAVSPPQPSGSAARASPPKSLPKIVAFGDSLTAGYGLAPDQSYPALLQKTLDAEGFEYEVVNAGVSGDTSAGGLRRLDWSLEDDVRIVILELGANDVLRGQPVRAMKKNLAEIIERVKKHGAQVLLCGMEAPTNSGVEYRNEVHAAFDDLAREHEAAFIPFFLEGVAGVGSLNQRDGIHPNVEGTRIVAETVARSLRPLLNPGRPHTGR